MYLPQGRLISPEMVLTIAVATPWGVFRSGPGHTLKSLILAGLSTMIGILYRRAATLSSILLLVFQAVQVKAEQGMNALGSGAADSFVVTIDSSVTTVDSVLAGVGLPLKIKAVARDSRHPGAFRVVEDYRKAEVRIRVDAGDQDIGAVEFRGIGVTDHGGGTATLDGAGWSAGARTVEVRSTRPLDAFSVLVAESDSEDMERKSWIETAKKAPACPPASFPRGGFRSPGSIRAGWAG